MSTSTNEASNLAEAGLREKRLPRKMREVQNKAPAPQQITAEQILREAHEMQFEKQAAPPRQQISDPEELRMYKLRKRKNFENTLRRNRMSIGVWLRYATWEESQKEFERSRSIFERLLDIDYQSASVWLKYAEMEMRNKFIHRARNVWDRAVQLLPRVDQLWFKYALMEENLSNFEGARRIFERWMKWNPGHKAWMSYIALEQRSVGSKADKLHRCRLIYDRYIAQHATETAFVQYAEWEYRQSGSVEFTRRIYETGMREMEHDGDEALSVTFYESFAKFEIACKEYDRARTIYQYALDHVARHRVHALFEEYMLFEKRYGSRARIDDVITRKKRLQYEEALARTPCDYDMWFDYIKLEEQNVLHAMARDDNADADGGDVRKDEGRWNVIRELYERAVSHEPPIDTDKRYWRRYIYLWIKYAMFEELQCKHMARARAVFSQCLQRIPHTHFTFGKLWIMAAEFELRRHDISAMRRIFGASIGKCPKQNVFNAYIGIEYQLGEFDRCRRIYEKYLELFPTRSKAWSDYASLEDKLQEYERAAAIYELGVQQTVLDEPQTLWSNYIEFEVRHRHYTRVRELFQRLLSKTKHVRVWINYAQFEAQINEPILARNIFKSADTHFKQQCQQSQDMVDIEQRAILLESWLQFESFWGNETQQNEIKSKQPIQIKKRRPIETADGSHAGYEEYYHYQFPDDEKQKDSFQTLLQKAKAWKMGQNDGVNEETVQQPAS
eukprot:CAMPEP_0202711074 /NCGR_PEP_ID=MMETSP1385-20130828/22943_1 /ASSEMBLY_ACC=CAM_ASM_000861 /TAXON_ID=933848 /ORGANISM="Elphidium margaritaceum" /LENGTH=729 /DNA_ID=CAMNT_0049370737 /DNA_START=27 /DNA_END=2216 /DNA_ORIENTATION=-